MNKKFLFIIFLSIIVLSCRLLDSVDEQKADVTITLNFNQTNNTAKLVKGKTDALNITSIDKAKLVIYNIDQSYTAVSNNYTEMVLPSTGSKYNFDEYWVNGIKDVLNDISSNNCTVESEHDLDIENNHATGKFEIDPGVKYFLVGLFENSELKYGGYSDVVNFSIGDSKTVNISLITANTSPTASFTFSPASGTTTTTFTFDASSSSDNEGETSVLQVRWDWENDGSWDTDYSTTKTATHQYSATGTYTVKLEVKDSGGLTNTTTKTVNVFQFDIQITGTAHFPPGVSAELNGSVVFVYTSIDNWNNYSSIYSGAVSGSGSSVSFTLAGIGINPGNYYLDIWKDNDKDGIRGSPGDYIGWYGTGELGNYVLSEFSISEGQTLNFDITVYIVPGTNTVSDIDGNVYNTIQIGNQTWMAENLKVTHYRNGDSIPSITDDNEWQSTMSGAYCNYDNEENYVVTYGRLYNWYAVNDSRGLAPTGWHIPSDEEWKQLEIYLGMSQTEADNTSNRGTDEGDKLKSTSDWYLGGNGTNEVSFTALPGGYRYSSGSFGYISYYAFFWSATEYSSSSSWLRRLGYENSGVFRDYINNPYGLSVRCIKGQVDQNTNPIASFTIDPISGTTETIFTFDASGSSDNEDATSALQVRWDWDNDGTFDTDYSTTKTATHQYSTIGTYTVQLEVNDRGGLTNTTVKEVIVSIENTGTVTDIDGNIYNTIQIGDQTWMAENLKVTHYRNGDPIPYLAEGTEWANLTDGAYCSYDNDDSNINTYGLLYNWYTVDDNRKLAPEGWRVPSDEEWKELMIYLGMSQNQADCNGACGTDEGIKLKSESGWSNNGNGTNESGFSALPGGYRHFEDYFYGLGTHAFYWTSTKYDNASAWKRALLDMDGSIYRTSNNKTYGFSIRCIMGGISQNTAPTASFTVSPESGTSATIFTFDASSCGDNEESSENLQVRWDWENDGTWDTNYTTTKTAIHQYTTIGTYTVNLEVIDSEGLTNSLSKTVIIQEQNNSVITFPDANFETLIREVLNKPQGDITIFDLGTITSISLVNNRNITNIHGIEYCSNLKYFVFLNNPISDIGPLASLVNLNYLGLGFNQISDIRPLAGLINLDTLGIVANPIVDITPLANLINLKVLSIGGSQVSDITSLTGLTNLAKLSLYNSQIVDISPLSILINLKDLYLEGNMIIDINPLSNLLQTTDLGLGKNQISNIESLSNLILLQNLFIGDNKIEDISPLSNLTNLVYISAGNNQISSIESLSNLNKLESFYVYNNNISDLSPLLNKINLVTIGLANNNINDISPLSTLTYIKNIYLESNLISDITPLTNLTSIYSIYLDNNQVVDIQPLVENTGINIGDYISLIDNPLSTTSIDTYIPQLVARGVNVKY